jgi:hypothetical protein
MQSPDQSAARTADRLALAVLVAAGLVALLTFRDYGLGWDDYVHAEYGELMRSFYASGLSNRRVLSWVNLYHYGGGFDLAAALMAEALPFTLFETRRLAGAIVGFLGLLIVWRTARRVGSPLAGLLALVLLAACPLFVGHAFMNAKDAPFAMAMAFLLYALVRAFDEYPNPTVVSVVLVGIGAGLALGTRILGVFGVFYALAVLVLLLAIEARKDGFRPAAASAGHFVVRLIPGFVLGYAVMALVWPWGADEPLNPLRALQYFSRFFEESWQELFGGRLINVTDMPRSYLPTLLALQLPVMFSLLATGGVIGALIAAFRRDLAPNRRAVFFLLVLAAALPIVTTLILRPALYNGFRHFLFVIPPMAILGGLAGAQLFGWLRTRGHLAALALAAIFVAGIFVPVIDMTRLHPFEYTYFNRLIGGVAGARDRYMLDYWGLSLKQASQGLAAQIAARGLKKPADRPWKLAVCGHHRSPQVELGPDFETTWDPKGADFAMMLGVFYCRALDAPVLVDVVRAGVSYARVYDLRGRSYNTLLTRPGLTAK